MSFLSRIYLRGWIVVLVAVLAAVAWFDAQRIRHLDRLTALGSEVPAYDASSSSGYVDGVRQLVAPAQNGENYQWVVQTQMMLAQGQWRLRHVDYDNAPFGRAVITPSPYRWWLATVAWCHHRMTGQPLAVAVERAALYAEPTLHALMLVAAATLTALTFGWAAAVIVTVGFFGLFPLGATFQPGQPQDFSLSIVCAFFTALPLVAAIYQPRNAAPEAQKSKRVRWLFALSGLAGGCGLWINTPREVVVLSGLAIGAAVAGFASRHKRDSFPCLIDEGSWRIWGTSGGAVVLVGYFVEFAPSGLGGFDWRSIHPAYGVAWLLIAEALERGWRTRGPTIFPRPRVLPLLAAAVLAIALPLAMWVLIPNRDVLIAGTAGRQLGNLPEALAAENAVDWLLRDGFTLSTVAVLLPLLVAAPAIWMLWISPAAPSNQRSREASWVGTGAVVGMLILAGFRLEAWGLVDALLLAFICPAVGLAMEQRRLMTVLSIAVAVLVSVALGVSLIAPPKEDASGSVTEPEAQALIERDLAQWLARRVGRAGAVVLAPPSLTVSCIYHGGARGLATPYLGNGDGFAAAIRIAAASSPDEAQALVHRRGVTHIIIPSWDSALDELARLGANQPENTLIGLLHRWLPPRWLRPVAYSFPKLAGFENQNVTVFEVVDVQDNASAVGRIAEYFAEIGDRDQAVVAARALANLYPDDQNALLAQVQVAMAIGDREKFLELVKTLETNLSENGDETLTWDRRVNLAIVLANAERPEPAREQLRRCLAEVDETHLRTLSTTALYRMQLLMRLLGEKISDPPLAALARRLLPPEMRGELP